MRADNLQTPSASKSAGKKRKWKKIYIEIAREKDIYRNKRESVPKAGGHPTQVYSGVHPVRWMDYFLSGDKISIEERAREGHTKVDKEVGAGFAAVAKATQARWKISRSISLGILTSENCPRGILFG